MRKNIRVIIVYQNTAQLKANLPMYVSRYLLAQEFYFKKDK